MKKFPLSLLALILGAATALGVILFDTGDPAVNTTAPGGSLTDSGWQYEGDWGGYLGTPISPQFFITAGHFGQASSVLTYQNVNYPLIASFRLPGSDFLIWKIEGTFPSFAPLFTKRNENGQHLVVIGRGTPRGPERYLDNTLRGWDWVNSSGTRRWGENDVADIVTSGGHQYLYATFDQHVVPNDHPNESHLSSGDSGGAVFLNDGGDWKLSGINYAVDDLFTSTSFDDRINAAIFDARGYYTPDPNNMSVLIQISGADPVPTGFYASRISSELAWIASVIADPRVGYEMNQGTLTYWRLTAPSTEIVYEVLQSTDLVNWSTATPQNEIVGTAGDLEQVKAKVNPSGNQLFLRLRVTRPSG